WGAMLSIGRDYLFSAPYLAIFPGVMISMLVLGLNLLGDGLRDALDPRMKV
ncbi:MAG: ABC transporter permease, partial [Kurthia sp.]